MQLASHGKSAPGYFAMAARLAMHWKRSDWRMKTCMATGASLSSESQRPFVSRPTAKMIRRTISPPEFL